MAQKNRLKYILLGLLKEKKQTGYDLAKSFDSDIGEFWNANHSQIYPLLKRMEQASLIDHELDTVGEKLEKKTYFLTALGQQSFEDWLKSPSEMGGAHDEFILKLYFINDARSHLLSTMISEQEKYHNAKLAQLQAQFKAKFPTDKEVQANFGHSLVLRHAIEREKGYRSWLEEINQTLEN